MESKRNTAKTGGSGSASGASGASSVAVVSGSSGASGASGVSFSSASELPEEVHPFPPYIPPHAKVLIMGTFPPQPKRWSMDFYYPNRTNDFWYMMGLIFFRDRDALYDRETRLFRLDKIKRLLDDCGIALNDTGHRIRRLAGNASDKFLEIIEPVDLGSLLARMPECRTLATTGEKAARTLADITGTEPPAMGASVVSPTGLSIWRMPSTSRAYPLALAKKAAYYEKLFRAAGIPVPESR